MEEEKHNAFQNCRTPQELYDLIEKVLRPSKDPQSQKTIKLDKTRDYGIFFKGDKEYYGQDGRLFDKRTLEQVHLPPDPVRVYEDARTCALTFRKLYPKLPTLPAHNSNAVAGLQEMAEWCISATEVVREMVLSLDVSIIEAMIGLLKELKELPASGFPAIDESVWNKAKHRADRIVEKYHSSTSRSKLSSRALSARYYRRTRLLYAAEIISVLVDVASEKDGAGTMRSYPLADNPPNLIRLSEQISQQILDGSRQLRFYKAVERIYRMMDKTYADGLAKLEQDILPIVNRINQLDCTPSGELLDKYDKLRGLKLKDRLERIVRAYSIDSIVESTLFAVDASGWFGGERKESLVDSVVDTLQEVLQAATHETPTEPEQKASPLQRAWSSIKRIPRWIYVLIIFLAALLTCVYLVWWLWTTFFA